MTRVWHPSLGLVLLLPGGLTAQVWAPGTSHPLVVAAAEARVQRDQDDALARWRATATGLVRFATVVEHGDGPIERVIRADELQVEVYGEAPNRSKQEIVAWRDTTFLPNSIVYHRDHLGIVANDFGAAIRLGDGDEVRDVPHPLSRAGLTHYEFAPGDTVTVGRPDGAMRVVAFAVRPADQSAPGTVGTIYLDLARAAQVQFRFTFTAASYRDPTVTDIMVILENALLDGQTWLPWRQSIAIRRESPWLELALGTILRADWVLGDYELGLPASPERFAGASIAGLRAPGGPDVWTAPLTTRLSEEPATTADRDAIRQLAAAHLTTGRLGGLPRVRLAGRGISDFVSVNRVQGVVLGLGGGLTISEWSMSAHLGIGTSSGGVVGQLRVARDVGPVTIAAHAGRAVRDIGDVPIVSRALNSLRVVLDGSDLGDWTLRDDVGVTLSRRSGRTHLQLGAGWVEGRPLETTFTALDGTRRPNPALEAPPTGVVRARVDRQVADGWLTLDGELAPGQHAWSRIALTGHGSRRFGPSLGTWRFVAMIGSRALPPWHGLVLGGRGTLPGVPYRAIGGRRGAFAEIAILHPIAVPSPPVGPWGKVPLPSRAGVFVAAGVAGGQLGATRWRGGGAVEPVVGVRLDLWGPLLRVDAGVALRSGGIGVTVDAHPDWWPLL